MAGARQNNNEDVRSGAEMESNKLLLYRLEQVENGVKAINLKLDGQENIKKSDLIEFRDAIVERFDEKVKGVQDDITDLKNSKADKTELTDLKKLFYSLSGLLGTIMTAIVIAFFTTRGGQ